MKTNQLFLLLSLALSCLTTNLYPAHVTKIVAPEVLPFQAALARFEILSQDLADQQKNKSLNLPVVIRKEIDTFINELRRKPQEKDIAALRSQLIKKYGQPLATAITQQLDAKREGSDATLRQLLRNNYGEATTDLAQRFAQDIIDLYIGNSKRLSIHLQKSPTDVQESIEHFAANKNSLLVDLFDYKRMDISAALRGDQTIEELSADGSLILTDDNRIYERNGDQYTLLHTFEEQVYGISKDFSVIIAGDGEPPDTHVYVLKQDQKMKKWNLAQTITQDNPDMPALSQNGSTIVLIDGNTVYSYARQGDHWAALKPLIVPEVKDNIQIEGLEGEPSVYNKPSKLSPHGLIMVLNITALERNTERGHTFSFFKRAIYQRQENGWTEVNLPQGEITFNTNDSLMLINHHGERTATVYAQNNDNWQKKQLFMFRNTEYKPHFFGNKNFIIINEDIYVQEPGYHWQKEQPLTDKKIDVRGSLKMNDDGTIVLNTYDRRGVIETIVFTRHGDRWHQTQLLASHVKYISFNGLTLANLHELYALPAATLAAAEALQAGHWALINDLYNAQRQGPVILSEEQRELFNTLPLIFQKAILSKWRVAKGTEKGVRYYQERQELKPNLSDEEMADYTELKNRELKELAQKLQGERKAQAATI